MALVFIIIKFINAILGLKTSKETTSQILDTCSN